jgi:RNA polymerase sigma factor (sigma-70 family)
MEAARTLTQLPERMRMRRFTAECEELRPLGIAYVLRHFGGSLDLADAEDAVAEVIIRFDRLAAAGRPPDRLRPAFFTSVRNAAYDQLRYRGVRPTAPLEAAATKTTEDPGPEERAEAHDDLVRLREAMARMRPNYREAIVLRFGLGLSVPEIAERVGISLPAAKKLVLRSTAQIRDRMAAIDGRQFCPEMQELARRSVLDGAVAGLQDDEAQAAAIKAHLEHCGPCRGFLASLRADLHELGGAALIGGLAAGKLGLPSRLLSGAHAIGHGVHAGVWRIRLASCRASGALSPEGNSAGLLAGTGQKLAAVCTAGAASAATCLATGIVGPGLGVGTTHHVDPHPTPPPAHLRKAQVPTHRPVVTYTAPENEADDTVSKASTGTAPRPRGTVGPASRQPKPEPEPERQPVHHTESKPATPAQTEQSEFGFEEEEAAASTAPSPEEAPAPLAASRSVEESTSSTSSSPEASAGNKASGSGHDEFGFGG